MKNTTRRVQNNYMYPSNCGGTCVFVVLAMKNRRAQVLFKDVKILRCFNPSYRRAAAKKRTPHRGGVRFWACASSVADTRRPATPR